MIGKQSTDADGQGKSSKTRSFEAPRAPEAIARLVFSHYMCLCVDVLYAYVYVHMFYMHMFMCICFMHMFFASFV